MGGDWAAKGRNIQSLPKTWAIHALCLPRPNTSLIRALNEPSILLDILAETSIGLV
jgi:hypothetical protein